jgi:hypothetical protein
LIATEAIHAIENASCNQTTKSRRKCIPKIEDRNAERQFRLRVPRREKEDGTDEVGRLGDATEEAQSYEACIVLDKTCGTRDLTIVSDVAYKDQDILTTPQTITTVGKYRFGRRRESIMFEGIIIEM